MLWGLYSVTPSAAMFSVSLVVGTCVAVSAPNWVIAWVGMELNLLSFVPLMILRKETRCVEAGVKYFTVQAAGSVVFLIAPAVGQYGGIYRLAGVVIAIGLLTKMGRVPLHHWLPRVMATVSWGVGYVLMTWQKVAPLWLLAALVSEQFAAFLSFLAVLNVFIGACGGMNQRHMGPLLGYSSVVHNGWMISILAINDYAAMVYLVLYAVVLFPVVTILNEAGSTRFNTVSFIIRLGPKAGLLFRVLLLRLAGMPPFLGFFLKRGL